MPSGGSDLVVKVAANITALQAGMASAATSVKALETTVKETSTSASKAFDGLNGVARNLATDLLALFSVRAGVAFVSDVIAQASALNTLSAQTHIGVEDLQRLAASMQQFGVDADTLGKGLYKLSQGIAGGDASVATGLHLMGLSLQSVKGLEGEALFLKIEHGLAQLQGGLRDTAASELFGSKLGAAMAGASEGIEGAMDAARQLNDVMTAETAAALDAFGVAIDRAKGNLSAMAANLIGPVAEGFNTLTATVEKGTSKWAVLWAMMRDSDDAILGTGTGTEHLTALLDKQAQATAAATGATKLATAAHVEAAVAVSAQTQATRFMVALEMDAAHPLLAWQREYLGHLQKIGELNAKNAAGIGVNVDQFNKYVAVTKAAAEADKQAAAIEAAAILATTKLWDEYFTLRVTHGGTANEIAIAQIDKWAADLTAQMIKAGTDTQAFYDALAATSHEKLAAVGIDWDFIQTHSIEALNETARNARATYAEMATGAKHFSRDVMNEQLAKIHEADDAARGYGRDFVAAEEAAAAATRKHNDDLLAQKKVVDALAAANRAMGNSTQYDLSTQEGRDKVDPAIARWLHDGYSLAQASAIAFDLAWGIPINNNDPLFRTKGPRVPGFAGGVEDFGGGWATVGERGPETMYVPPHASIYPTGSGAGASGGTTVIQLVVDGRVLASIVHDQFTKTMKQSRQYPAA